MLINVYDIIIIIDKTLYYWNKKSEQNYDTDILSNHSFKPWQCAVSSQVEGPPIVHLKTFQFSFFYLILRAFLPPIVCKTFM